MPESNKKLIVVLGPTACGKTKLAVRLAAKCRGEIISADSRQVYRGMDIGTGKDLSDYGLGKKRIPYHLIDVLSPKNGFNVAQYQKLAYGAIDDVLRRKKQPFLVGGTGLYIDAVTKGFAFSPEAKKFLISSASRRIQFQKIRKKLDKLTPQELLKKLKSIDFATYKIIDKKNRRRVQRAIEIYYETGWPKSEMAESVAPDYKILFLGIKFPLPEIYKRIDERLEQRIKQGMIDEVKRLRKNGLSWKKMAEFGLEYRWVSLYVRGEIDYEMMTVELKKAIHHFARRQLTWFRRNNKIIWVSGFTEAEKLVKKFLN